PRSPSGSRSRSSPPGRRCASSSPCSGARRCAPSPGTASRSPPRSCWCVEVSWKRWLLGSPLETSRLAEERLGVPLALAVFASDALSSVAYATEEILLVLSTAGLAALYFSLPIAIIIACLLALLIASYRQTVHAYPDGGGSYLVARENLGTMPGLV